jgi:hypothetical protein
MQGSASATRRRRHLTRNPLAAGLCLLSLALAACYRYVPADMSELGVGREVRLRLSDAESSRFNGILAPGTRLIEGRVLEAGRDTLLVQVPVSSDVQGARVETLNQRLDLARSGIVAAELRQLDRTKTAILLVGGGGLGVALLVEGLRGAFRSGEDNNNDPGQDIVVPVFLRIRF